MIMRIIGMPLGPPLTSAYQYRDQPWFSVHIVIYAFCIKIWPGRVAQSVGHLTRKSEVLGSISGLAPYFRFSFRRFKKGSCQLLAKVCARSTG